MVEGKGQLGHFLVFLETITDCNTGFRRWRRLQNSRFFPIKIGLAQAKKESHTREARDPRTPGLPVSLSVFSLAPELLFDCSRVLEYAKYGLFSSVAMARSSGNTAEIFTT